jgi:hypothetical protein
MARYLMALRLLILSFLAFAACLSTGKVFGVSSHSFSCYRALAVTEPYTQENSNLTDGPGIKAHWNLSDLIGSTANSFDSAVADVDGDGDLEAIVSKDNRCEFYCLEQDGSVLWHTPILSSHGPGYYGSEVVDIDGDGTFEFVAAADSIWVFDAATGVEKWAVLDVGGQPDEVPWILGHVSSANQWDVIVARARDDHFVVSVYDWMGNLVWTTAIEDAIYGHTLSAKDVDADGYSEIFVPCSKKTVAIDHDGTVMWTAPLTPVTAEMAAEFLQVHDLAMVYSSTQVIGWWYHSDFAEVTDLYNDGRYYVLHDYGGGVLDPTVVQILDALTGEVVDSFESAGHHQWLKTANLRADSEGQEIVYVTREKVVMRDSNLKVVWERELSGAHELGLGDWDGDGLDDIIVSTIFRGLERLAGVDSNFVVYNALGDVIYNMLYHYPQDSGKYAGAQMQSAMKGIRDCDGDGRVDVAVCFSNHDEGKFDSSQDVHQYIMSLTDISYSNEFHEWGNDSTSAKTDTLFTDDALQLSYLVPDEEYADAENVVLLMHMNEGTGSLVEDGSSYGNHGTLHHGEWVDEGRFGSAIQFGGQNAICIVHFSDSLDFDQVAVEVWLKVAEANVAQSIVEKPGAFGLQVTDAGRLVFYILDSTAMRGKRPYIEAPFTVFDRFAHVVATYDGSLLRLVVDGEEVATDSHVGAIGRNTNGLYIGNNYGGTMPVQGIIDELRISNAVQPLPVRASGEWVSDVVFPVRSYGRHATLEFDHALNGGNILYDILDDSDNPILGHTHIVSSPHDLGEIVDPIKVRAYLVGGTDIHLSPRVDSIRVIVSYCAYLPIIAKSACDN